MSKTVVVASGYFNPLHYGHVSYLQKAKDAGTHLIVIVNNDKQAEMKMRAEGVSVDGGIPGMPARDRVRLVRSLACVDAAIEAVDEDQSVADTLRMLHPDLFANGGAISATAKEAAVCQELGIKMIDGLGIEMLLLKPFTQHYEWGKKRGTSAVAALTGEAQGAENLTSPGSARPYAELWMGDHPAGPSKVSTPGGKVAGCLISALKRSPSVLGEKLAQDAQLPFLLKVLSIEKALSIQAHPDRELAARLHRDRPDIYKDPNHKPEIAIALTDFEALCGFRPVEELSAFVEAVPELHAAVGWAAAEGLRRAVASGDASEAEAALKEAFCTMMRTAESDILRLIPPLLEREGFDTLPEPFATSLAKACSLVKRLHDQFGNDIGLFSIFFLNYVEMSVGECLYMPQNTPHAYLSGDIVECMACSDNVVRGGLTPKYKDIEVLCEMLVYRGGLPPSIKAEQVAEQTWLYQHEALEEFQVTKLLLSTGASRRFCFSGQGPSLGFVFSGSGMLKISDNTTRLEAGIVFLLSAGVDCDISATDDLHCYVACCPPQYFGPPPRRQNSHTMSGSPSVR